MQQRALWPSGMHSVFVTAILMAILGLGSLTVAFHDSEDAPWSAMRISSPAGHDRQRQAGAQRAPSDYAGIRPPTCQPRQLMCAGPEPTATTASHDRRKKVKTGPGEREIFLFGSAAVAHRRVWVQEFVEVPPAADFQMIASTSPYP
jgi:hypothetical protein